MFQKTDACKAQGTWPVRLGRRARLVQLATLVLLYELEGGGGVRKVRKLECVDVVTYLDPNYSDPFKQDHPK